MCNFHESVAILAATDPSTGKIHAGHKAVIRVALSRYWASRYVEGAENVDGYNYYPLATTEQQSAFERSGLKRSAADIAVEEAQGIAFLRGRVAELSKSQDLSAKGLGLPVSTAREPFMDLAIEHIYEGNPRGQFNVIERVDRNDLQPLHRAVAALHADSKTSAVLERLVQGKICTLYSEAPGRVNKSLVEAYERLPERVKAVSSRLAQYGGNIVLGGFSGIIGHGLHYASVLGVGVAAGTASSLNMTLSGVFLLASYGGWHQAFGGQYKATKEKLSAFVVQAALTAAVAVGGQHFLSHDHMSSEKAQWYQSLPPEMQESLLDSANLTYAALPTDLRQRLEEMADKEGIPPSIYLLTCSGDDPVSRDIAAFMAIAQPSAAPLPAGP